MMTNLVFALTVDSVGEVTVVPGDEYTQNELKKKRVSGTSPSEWLEERMRIALIFVSRSYLRAHATPFQMRIMANEPQHHMNNDGSDDERRVIVEFHA